LALRRKRTLNPNIEIRNKFKIGTAQIRNQSLWLFWIFLFGDWDLFRISDFDIRIFFPFRISDFPLACPFTLFFQLAFPFVFAFAFPLAAIPGKTVN
jgi:hypothetical protein